MTKNFFSFKTGHKASDEYFKNLATWHDIDLVKAFMFGMVGGAIISILVVLSL